MDTYDVIVVGVHIVHAIGSLVLVWMHFFHV
jgi:hypothetical protein